LIEAIIESYEKVFHCYQKAVTLSESVFIALKEKKFEELERLNKSEKENVENIECCLQELKHHIVAMAKKKNVVEPKITSLLPYLSEEEKEKLLDVKQRAFHYEKRLKNNAEMNKCLAEAMMRCSETVVDTWVYMAKKEQKENAFVNKKY
jgi:hypothetical protein